MTDTTRDAFEAEANLYDMDLNRFKEGYSDCNTDYGWLFWQAATLAEQGKRQPLTDDEIEAIGHRKATTYTHRTDPTSHAYGFVRLGLIDFTRAIEAAHGITATPQGKP